MRNSSKDMYGFSKFLQNTNHVNMNNNNNTNIFIDTENNNNQNIPNNPVELLSFKNQ